MQKKIIENNTYRLFIILQDFQNGHFFILTVQKSFIDKDKNNYGEISCHSFYCNRFSISKMIELKLISLKDEPLDDLT